MTNQTDRANNNSEDYKLLPGQIIEYLVPFDIMDVALSQRVEGYTAKLADAERQEIIQNGRVIYRLKWSELGSIGEIELRKRPNGITEFAFSVVNSRDKELFKKRKAHLYHLVSVLEGAFEEDGIWEIHNKALKELEDETAVSNDSLEIQNQLRASRGLALGLQEGYFEGEAPPEKSLVKEISYSGSLQHFQAFMKRLCDTDLAGWEANNGVFLEVYDTFPPDLKLPIGRWHIQPYWTNNPHGWATMTAYEEGPNKTRICFYDGYNAISEPHERLKLGSVLMEIAEFIEEEARKSNEVGETAVTTRSQSDQRYLNEVIELIENNFNIGELQKLIFNLGENHENFPDKGKSHLVREFVEQFDRNGRIDDLKEKAIEMRPHISWPAKS